MYILNRDGGFPQGQRDPRLTQYKRKVFDNKTVLYTVKVSY